jgi:hypothetical protein
MVRGYATEESQCYVIQYLKEASGLIIRAIKAIGKARIHASELERGYEKVKYLESGPAGSWKEDEAVVLYE